MLNIFHDKDTPGQSVPPTLVPPRLVRLTIRLINFYVYMYLGNLEVVISVVFHIPVLWPLYSMMMKYTVLLLLAIPQSY